MHIIKQTGIAHLGKTFSDLDEKNKRKSIFSVHISPVENILATAGIDGKVKIWNLVNLNSPIESPMQSLEKHSGSVLCVRFSFCGKFLASSSDDKTIVIWTKKTEFDFLKKLNGHDSDVSGVCWSYDQKFLASCGLEGKILIWDAVNFEIVTALNEHSGFVKGIAFDPVSQFLSSQSEDGSLIIWRMSDWKLERKIEEPFESSGAETYFRRQSWSPDGSTLIGTNAINGLYCVASIIDRENWSSDNSLVGHQAPVEVACFNPNIYETDSEYTVCALGGQDTSVSLWSTQSPNPLLVATNLFTNSVLDLCWSSDGTILAACSFDGTVAFLKFENEEFGRKLESQKVKMKLAKSELFHKQLNLPSSVNVLEIEKQIQKNATRNMDENAIEDEKIVEKPCNQPLVIRREPRRINLVSVEENSTLIHNQANQTEILLKPTNYTDSTEPVPFIKSSKGLYRTFVNEEGLRCVFEAKKDMVEFSVKGETKFAVDFPSPVLMLCSDGYFHYVVCKDSFLYVLQQSGQRSMPPILIGTPIFLQATEGYVITVSKEGQVRMWNMVKRKSLLCSNVSCLIPAGVSLCQPKILKNGVPLISLSNGIVYTFDFDMDCWMKLSDTAMFPKSIYTTDKLVDPVILAKNLLQSTNSEQQLQSLGYLEHQMAVALIFDSAEQYTRYLMTYCKVLVDVEDLQKANQVCASLVGIDSICGLEKKDLLSKVLQIFAKSSKLQGMVNMFSEL